MKNMDRIIENFKEKIRKDGDILALILFGSYVRGDVAGDVDLCMVMSPAKASAGASAGFDKRIKYSQIEGLDVQVFQDLPIYIKKRVLKEGKVLYSKDEDLLHDIAIKTAKDFELFRPKYKRYLEGVAKG